MKNPASFSIDEILSSPSGDLTTPANQFTESSTPNLDDPVHVREMMLGSTPSKDMKDSSSEGGALYRTSSLNTSKH